MSEAAKKERPKTTRVKLTGMWQKTGANGVFWSGTSEDGTNFTMYVNGYKTEDKHPEFILYIDQPDPEGKIEKYSGVKITGLEVTPPKPKKG